MRGAGAGTGGEIKGGAMKRQKRNACTKSRVGRHHQEITAIKDTLLNRGISGAVAPRPGPCKQIWTLSSSIHTMGEANTNCSYGMNIALSQFEQQKSIASWIAPPHLKLWLGTCNTIDARSGFGWSCISSFRLSLVPRAIFRPMNH